MMMTSKLILLSVVLLALGVSPIASSPYHRAWQTQKSSEKPWTDCTKSGDHGKIVAIKISPYPPRRGENVSIIANTTIDETLSSGQITTIIKFGALPFQQVFDLCKLLKQIDNSCPVPKGPFNIVVNQKIESSVPPGDYEGEAVATDQNKQRIFCLRMKFTLD